MIGHNSTGRIFEPVNPNRFCKGDISCPWPISFTTSMS
jgi:hypothetical protein